MLQNDPLAILFGSVACVKLLRFFLFNPTNIFSFEEIARRARLVRRTARTELNMLERAGVIERKYFFETLPGKRTRKRRVLGYALNGAFPFLQPLQAFFFATAPINSKTMLTYVKKVGAFDVVVAAGVFVGDFDRRLDVLLVARKVSDQKVEQAIRALESELGIEIKYAYLDTEEFLYRVNMRDKLIRDVFDYAHQVLVDKLRVYERSADRIV
ncbi:hypothetical protein HY416_02590 [Candidatus Kaiserbacteria bacterium]|nr:hypothetical protein [Candidatus Kaiserbacteria bacterium]